MAEIKFTYEKRSELEQKLKEKVAIYRIAKMLGVSHASIYKELKRNIPEKDYKEGNWTAYSAKNAQEKTRNEFLKKIGEL